MTLCPTVSLPSLGPQHPNLVYGHCLDLGDYTYDDASESWTHRRAAASGEKFLVCGRGFSPTAAQCALWHEAEARLPELVATSIAAITPPLFLAGEFRRESLMLSEVRFESDGTVQLFFDSPPLTADIGPRVAFSSWEVAFSDWQP